MDSLDLKYPGYMVYCVVIACLGSFSNGWVIGSPNIPGEVTHNCANGNAHINNKSYPDCLPMDNALWGFAVASFCVGGLIGGLSGGAIQTKIGRKKTIIFNNLGFIIGGILIGCAVDTAMFIVGRILCGLSCGLGSLVIPCYIGEVSTISARGAMGTCNQFFIVIGILLSSVVGLPLANVPLWRINYAIVAIPAIIQFFLMNTCVETPRYLVSVNRIDEARQSLQKLRRNTEIDREFYGMVEGSFGTAAARSLAFNRDVSNIPAEEGEKSNLRSVPDDYQDVKGKMIDESEFDDNDPASVPTQQHENMNMFQIFFSDPVICRIALIVVFLHAGQQLVGINAVMYYSTTIFNLAFDPEFSKYMAIITTVVNFIMTAISVAVIDRMGRRPLLLISNAGACVFCILLVIGYTYQIGALLVVSVFGYVASFAIGIGPIPWLMTSEITPTYASSSVGATATCVNWTMNFIIGQCFPIIFARIQGYSFVIFAAISVLSFVFTLICVPETKGRTLETVVQGFEKYRS